MLNRALADLREADLSALVANGIAEGRDLEFKRDWPGASDADVKEFLADVTSLANAQGGDLIFGVEDRAGIAASVPGVDGTDLDATLLRLENIVRDCIAPRLGVRPQWVSLGSGRGVLVMRVPASLAAPHRVTFKNTGRFYTRNSKGKYEMDVHELRQAFTASEALPARLRQLHEEAVRSAHSGHNMPFIMDGDPTAVLSLMPLGILRERRDLVLTPENTILPVKARGGMDFLPTLEGLLWHTPMRDGNAVRAFTLTHRSGRIDAAWTFGGARELKPGQIERFAWPTSFEEGVVEMVQHGIGRLQSYGIEGPWVAFVSVIRITGYRLVLSDHDFSRPAWRESAALPDVLLEALAPEGLLPIHRAFWLLFGLDRPADRP